MRVGNSVCLAYEFWITGFSEDTLTISVDVSKDLHQTVHILRCIPAFNIYPSYMDYKMPEKEHIPSGGAWYKVVVPPNFRTTGVYQLKGVRETLDWPAELRGEFDRDKPMGGLLNLRIGGEHIHGIIDRIFIKKGDDVIYIDEIVNEDAKVVFVNLNTLTEYEVHANLLKLT